MLQARSKMNILNTLCIIAEQKPFKQKILIAGRQAKTVAAPETHD